MPRHEKRGGAGITKRYELRMAKARLAELVTLRDQGQLSALALRQDAWADVADVMASAHSPRTRLMADRMVLDRTDPIPRAEGPSVAVAVQVTWQTPPELSSSPTPLDGSRPNSTNGHVASERVSWSPTDDSAKP